MRLINLHVVLIVLVASFQAAASFIPTEERGTSFPCEISRVLVSYQIIHCHNQPLLRVLAATKDSCLVNVNLE